MIPKIIVHPLIHYHFLSLFKANKVCWESCGGGTCNLPENQLGWCRPFQKNPVESQPRYVPAHHWEAVNMTKVGSIAPGVADRWGGGQVAGKWRNVQIDLLLVCVNIYIYIYIIYIYMYFSLNPFEKYSSKWIISPNFRCEFFWNNYLKPPSLANDLPAMSKCQAPKGHEKHWPPSSSVTRRGLLFQSHLLTMGMHL